MFGKIFVTLIDIAQEIGEKLHNLKIWKYMHYKPYEITIIYTNTVMYWYHQKSIDYIH